VSDGLALWLTGVAGAAAGAVFYAGLHWTVRRALSSRRPVRLLLASFAARLALVAALLGAALQGPWQGVVVALAGIVLARTVVLARLNRRAPPVPSPGARA